MCLVSAQGVFAKERAGESLCFNPVLCRSIPLIHIFPASEPLAQEQAYGRNEYFKRAYAADS